MKNKLLEEAILKGIDIADNLSKETVNELVDKGADAIIDFVRNSDNKFDDRATIVASRYLTQLARTVHNKLASPETNA